MRRVAAFVISGKLEPLESVFMPIRWLNKVDSLAFLAARTEGRLATCNQALEPYITPLNYFYFEDKIYFHSKLSGRKLNNIIENKRVCFEVSEVDRITFSDERACACSTRYTSVLVFGPARVVVDETEKAVLLNRLVERFAAGRPFPPVEVKDAARVAVVEISIEEISGKRNVDPEPPPPPAVGPAAFGSDFSGAEGGREDLDVY
jgi:nitroimidazol reductase NimA-like FMN-containing flavoprotein (pyridoxamine 5'-phosphate oxidase superfamily)